MLSPDRFIANKALDFPGWVEARRLGVTATQVAKASTPAGFSEAIADVLNPPEPFDNPYMAFGREQEGSIGLWLKDQFDVFPNEWLIAREATAAEGLPMEFATPDGLSLDHTVISEVKTTGKDWSDSVVPIQYRRQVQWQLYVTGAEYCILAWLLRAEVEGRMVPAWFEPKHMTLERDAGMIDDLVATANRLWEETQTAQNEREK
jgi:hypothetical protein